jgi:hypothetical protein
MVRRHPNGGGGHQVVLLDYGLCVAESDAFRRSYARLFRAMMLQVSQAARARAACRHRR